MKTLCLLLCLLTWGWNPVVASTADDFAAANEAYSQRDFAKAISTYESLVRRGEYRPEIFYNLGLVFQQSANPAKAVLNLERALLLSPGFADAQPRLESLTGDSTSVWWNQIPKFGSNVSIAIAVCAAWLILLSLVARWRILGGTRAFWTVGALLSIAALVAAASSYIYRDQPLSSPNRAIVLKPEKLRSNFTESSPSILALRAGQAVEITSINGPWTQCLLPDQTRGWVPSPVLERVVLR